MISKEPGKHLNQNIAQTIDGGRIFFARDIMSAYLQWSVAASNDRLQRAKQ